MTTLMDVVGNSGDLVLSGPGRQMLWHSGTAGQSAGKAIMQAMRGTQIGSDEVCLKAAA